MVPNGVYGCLLVSEYTYWCLSVSTVAYWCLSVLTGICGPLLGSEVPTGV